MRYLLCQVFVTFPCCYFCDIVRFIRDRRLKQMLTCKKSYIQVAITLLKVAQSFRLHIFATCKCFTVTECLNKKLNSPTVVGKYVVTSVGLLIIRVQSQKYPRRDNTTIKMKTLLCELRCYAQPQLSICHTQRWTLSMIINWNGWRSSQIKLITLNMVWQIFLNPEFGIQTKFRREVSLFLEIPEFS